jgi:hypothetical protein
VQFERRLLSEAEFERWMITPDQIRDADLSNVNIN